MIRDIIPYLYLNARIMAKEAKLLSPDQLETLISASSVMEVISALEETEYGEYISDVTTNKTEAVEEILLRQNAEIFREIFNIIPKKIASIFTFLVNKWDVHNIRVVIRGIHSGLPGEDINERLIPVGELSEDYLKELVSCRSMEDLMLRLEETPYRILADGLAAYEKSKNLVFIEAKLDKIFLDTVWQQISNGKRKRMSSLVEYFTMVVDCLNLKILLRAKKDGLSLKEIEDFLFIGGRILPIVRNEFDSGHPGGPNLIDFITLLEGTIYFQPLMEALPDYEKDNSLMPLERALNRFIALRGRDMAIKQPWGFGPLLGFLTVKEEEIKKIRCIAKSKEMGLGTEETRNLLAEL